MHSPCLKAWPKFIFILFFKIFNKKVRKVARVVEEDIFSFFSIFFWSSQSFHAKNLHEKILEGWHKWNPSRNGYIFVFSFIHSFIKLQSIFLLKHKCLIKSVCFPSTSFFSLLGERNKSSRLEIPPFTQSFSGL